MASVMPGPTGTPRSLPWLASCLSRPRFLPACSPMRLFSIHVPQGSAPGLLLFLLLHSLGQSTHWVTMLAICVPGTPESLPPAWASLLSSRPAEPTARWPGLSGRPSRSPRSNISSTNPSAQARNLQPFPCDSLPSYSPTSHSVTGSCRVCLPNTCLTCSSFLCVSPDQQDLLLRSFTQPPAGVPASSPQMPAMRAVLCPREERWWPQMSLIQAS